MTRTILAAAALLAATCTANAASLPQYYVGQWESCGEPLEFGHVPDQYYRVDDSPCMNKKFLVTVTPNSMRTDNTDCRFIGVRRDKGADSPATKTPRSEWIPRIRILANCTGGRMFIYLNAGHGVMQMVITGEKEGD